MYKPTYNTTSQRYTCHMYKARLKGITYGVYHSATGKADQKFYRFVTKQGLEGREKGIKKPATMAGKAGLYHHCKTTPVERVSMMANQATKRKRFMMATPL